MKRFSGRRQAQRKWHARYRDRKRKARLRKKGRPGVVERWAKLAPIDCVAAPRLLYLFRKSTHQVVTEFLKKLRRSFALAGITTVIDLSKVDRLLPAGTLLFYAELHRLIRLFPNKSFKFIKSRDDVVNQVLEHLKVFALAGYSSGAVPKRDDVISWRTATSVITDGKPAGELIETYESLSRAEIRHIFRGVSEAATNAVEHAYVAGRGDGLPAFDESRWWMFCRESENRLYVGVCDLGVGIPKSLPKTYGEELLAWVFKAFSLGSMSEDASMIRAAMEIARTRTDQEERGKGLGDMRQVVDQLPGSKLYIFSNKGLLTYENGEFGLRQYANSIFGTMVVWIIPVEGAKE